MGRVLHVVVDGCELAVVVGPIMASVLRMVWVEVSHGEARRSKTKPPEAL